MSSRKKWKWSPGANSPPPSGRTSLREATLGVLKDIESRIARYFHKNKFPLELDHLEHEQVLDTGEYRGRKLSRLDQATFWALWELLKVRKNLAEGKHESALFNSLLMSGHILSSQRLEVEPDLVRSKKVIAGASKGAQTSSHSRKQRAEPLHVQIVAAAENKLKKGLHPRNLCSSLAMEFDLTSRQIANILAKAGVRERKSPKRL